MRYTLALILFFLIFFLNPFLYAEVLKEVIILGNKRTTKEAIILHAQIRPGKNLSPNDVEEIVSNLHRINQIILKNVQFQDGILTINLEDKWTLFPVPMITQSGNYYNRGFLIYEDNFLGSLGTFAPGISWSNKYLNAIFYYQDESLFSRTTGIKVLLLRKSELVELKRHHNVINTHESRYDSILISPNLLFKEHVFKAGPLVTHKRIFDQNGLEEYVDHSFGLFFRHHLNAYKTLGVMSQGLVTTYDLYTIRGGNRKWYFRHEADAKMSIPFEDNFINLSLHGHTVNDRSFLFTKIIGGDEGFRGYDKSSVPATSNLGFLAQYQQKLFDSVYLAPFYEFNNTRLIIAAGGSTLNENAVGIGLRYYFKKISIPAVIFDLARNLDDKSTHFLLNIGATL